jgi:hypothetical protein
MRHCEKVWISAKSMWVYEKYEKVWEKMKRYEIVRENIKMDERVWEIIKKELKETNFWCVLHLPNTVSSFDGS